MEITFTYHQKYNLWNSLLRNKSKVALHIHQFATFINIYISPRRVGDSELPVWEQNRSNQRPDVETCSCPPSQNTNPYRGPPHIYQLSTLPNRGWPSSQKHCRVHTRKREDDVEEGIRICDWLSLLLFFFLTWLVVQWKQRFVGT